jgi:putative DNA primase/helicase
MGKDFDVDEYLMNQELNEQNMMREKEKQKEVIPDTTTGVYSHKTFFTDEGKFKPFVLSAVLRKHNHFVTIRDNDDIYMYNEETGVYEISDAYIKEKVVYYLKDDYLEYRAKLTIDDLKVHTYTDRENFKAPLQYINVLNGVIDISELPVKKLLPHDPKYFFTWKLPVVYDPNAECPKFLKALEEILPSEVSRIQIQEMFGWCLWRDYHLQEVFMLVGDGNNGKDTLLNVLIRLLGDGNYSNVALQALCEDKFLAAELYQKFANIMSELPKNKKLKDTNIFKSLTGGASITVQRKFGQPFNFINFSKLIFGMNEVPYSYDQTFAYFRRLVLVFFTIRFGTPGHPVDKHILEKITTPEELSGILNWALEGLQHLQENDEFTGRMTVEETREYYEQLMSPIYSFISENITETNDPKDFIHKEYLMKEIDDYCEEKKLSKSTSPHQVTGIMKHNFKKIKLAQRNVEKPHAYVWMYCKFVDERRQKKYDEWFFKVTGENPDSTPPTWKEYLGGEE